MWLTCGSPVSANMYQQLQGLQQWSGKQKLGCGRRLRNPWRITFFLVNLKEVLAKHKTAEVGKAWTGPGYCKSGWGLVDLDWQCSLGVEGTL